MTGTSRDDGSGGLLEILSRKSRSFLGLFRPEEFIILSFVAILAILLIYYGIWPHWTGGTVKKIGYSVVTIIVFALFSNHRFLISDIKKRETVFLKKLSRLIYDFSPFMFGILVYDSLHDVVKTVRPQSADQALMRMDEFIFGVQPTIWLEYYIKPWFTDYMAFCYALMFFLPALLAYILYHKGRYADFRNITVALVIIFIIGYIGYIAVPAEGPRSVLREQYSVDLQGDLYDKSANVWNNLQTFQRDCFPSLHTAFSAIALFFAFKYRAVYRGGHILFWIYLPLTVSLWFSTVYLRYHWVVDVIAGLILTLFAYFAAPKLNTLWHERIKPLPQNEENDAT